MHVASAAAFYLQSLQKRNQCGFVFGVDFQPNSWARNSPMPQLVALETRRRVIVSQAGRIEPLLERSYRAIVVEKYEDELEL